MTTISNPAAEAPTVAILSNDGTELLAILQDGTVRGTIEGAGPAAQQFVAALRGLTEAIAAQAKAEALRGLAKEVQEAHPENPVAWLRARAATIEGKDS